MINEPNSTGAGSNEDPLMDFSNCHVGIIKNFERLRNLAETEIEVPVQAEVKDAAKRFTGVFSRMWCWSTIPKRSRSCSQR